MEGNCATGGAGTELGRSGKLGTNLPEIHIHELHEGVPGSAGALDAVLFLAKLAEVVSAKAQDLPNECVVGVRVLKTAALESADEISIASGQTPKSPKEDLCHEDV